MPRKPRLDGTGFLHHVIARGIEKRDIFSGDKDRNFFLERLGKVLTETATLCYAFALIPNHFHLLLRTGRQPISTVMRRLLTAYAVHFNRRQKRTGYLFQNRYRDIICQEDAYLLELIRYIHLNPLREKVVSDLSELDQYKFCGHHFLVENKDSPWFQSNLILEFFGDTTKKARNAYRAYMVDGLKMGKRPEFAGGGLRRSLGYPKTSPKERVYHDERILGDSDFVLNLTEEDNLPETDPPFKDIEELAEKVCQMYSLTKEHLTGEGRSLEITQARALVSYHGVRSMGMSAAAIARHLGLNRSSVTRLIGKGSELAQKMDIS